MSIKPIDHNVMLPRTQEIASTKHIENVKNKNIVDSGFRLQEKTISKNSQKIKSREKNENARINDNKSKRNQHDKSKKDGDRKNDDSKEDADSYIVGNNIDIRI